MNEPHAPIYFNGQYHLFFQSNPQGSYWHNIHWGHWVSTDMVHWRDLPPALSPSLFQVDPDGDWTGSSIIDDNGNPTLFFTAGNDSKTINVNGQNLRHNQNVGLARSTFTTDGDNDLKNWVKEPTLAVEQQVNQGMMGEFRDPFVFKDGTTWYMLVGPGVSGQGGTALVYTSTDSSLMNWQYQGPLYQSDPIQYPQLGTVWELPVLSPIGTDALGHQKYIFIISPYGGQANVAVYYWIGSWDKTNCRFIPDQAAPQLMDFGGSHFTGPSSFIDPNNGRTVLYRIAQGERTSQADSEAGWAHNAGLPVALNLRTDGQLEINPISELQSLRGSQLVDITTDTTFAQANQILSSVQGDTLEIDMELASGSANKVGMYVKKSPTSGEQTLIYYNNSTQEYGVDRSSTVAGQNLGVNSGNVNLSGDNVKLHIFLDKSMVESYLNGLKSLTTRAYSTSSDALGLQLYGDVNPDTITVKHLQIWGMNSAYTSVQATGVSINAASTTLYTGGNKTLYATVSPSNATNKDVTWTSSNSAVATVVNGQVKGQSAGTAIITAKTRDGNHTATSTVTVVASPDTLSLINPDFETGNLSGWTPQWGPMHWAHVKSKDLVKWEHLPQYFRDLKLFKHCEDYYSLIASHNKDGSGQLILYKSKDLLEWTYTGVILANMQKSLGSMWQCLKLVMDSLESNKFGLKVLKDKENEIVLYYDKKVEKFIFDRSKIEKKY